MFIGNSSVFGMNMEMERRAGGNGDETSFDEPEERGKKLGGTVVSKKKTPAKILFVNVKGEIDHDGKPCRAVRKKWEDQQLALLRQKQSEENCVGYRIKETEEEQEYKRLMKLVKRFCCPCMCCLMFFGLPDFCEEYEEL